MDFGRNARKGKQSLHARRNAREHRNHDRDYDAQAHRVSQALFSSLPVPLAQAQCGKRVAAVADEHAQRHEDGHKGHGCRGHRKADFAHGLAQENGVDNVVGAIDEHAHNGGNGKLQHQLRNGARAHSRRTIVALRRRFPCAMLVHRSLFEVRPLLFLVRSLNLLFGHAR